MDRTVLSSLALLSAVAARLNFRAAARDLGMSASALSHAIADLEDRLGLRLLNRTTRSVTLTDAGRHLLSRIDAPLQDITQALEDARAEERRPSGLLRLTLPRMAIETVMLPLADAFHAAYPEVVLDLVADDHLVDIVADGFDAGLRLGELIDQDMIVQPVGGRLRSVVVASPAYLAHYPPPRTPADLGGHRCIGRRFAKGPAYRWEFAKDGRALSVTVPSALILNDSGLVVNAALAGQGLGYCVWDLVAPHLASGRLVSVLDDWCPDYPGFFLYYPSRRHVRPALRALIDFLHHRRGEKLEIAETV